MNSHTVLVVEDEYESREILSQILELEGFAVAAVANGAEALDYLRANPSIGPCLIVLDLMMPVMDGRQFHAEISRDKVFSKIPIVIVSALDEKSSADLSAIKVLRKPLNVDVFLNVVRANC